MNLVFFGTPDFAAASLEALLAGGYPIPFVVTQPDQPSGRGRKLAEPPVKRLALARGIPVEQPRKLRDPEFLAKLRGSGSDLFVVAAYGRILPDELLAIPRMALNVHASLLPRWRGAAPVARAILAGDAVTGVSIMRIVRELDAGDVCLRKETPIGEEETCGELTERLARIGGEALLEALKLVEAGTERFSPQDSAAVTLAPPVKAEEGKIDWAEGGLAIDRRVRAFQPWPGAFAWDGKQRIKILKTAWSRERKGSEPVGTLRGEKGRLFVAAADGWLEILELQREGKARQEARSFLPGYPVASIGAWR